MLRLKDRQNQIPNGYRFYLPEIKWSAPGNFPSFKVVCDGLEAAIRANPFQAKKFGWPTDRTGIEDWVDKYNAELCSRMGWTDYIASNEGGASLPKMSPQHQLETLRNLGAAAVRVKELVAGAKTLMEWDESGEPPVPQDVATSRAIICSTCPLNQEGDFTKWFTTPAAELIRRRIQKAQQRKLTTPRDEMLNLCVACHCPLKLKVHVPLSWITKRLTQEQKDKLDPKCWIRS